MKNVLRALQLYRTRVSVMTRMRLRTVFGDVNNKVKEIKKDFITFSLSIGAGIILLFFLPNETIDPWGIINPFFLVLIVIVVLGIQFVAYVAIKLWKNAGLLAFGALVGFVNSNIINGALASLTKQNPELAKTAAASVILGNMSMLVRNLILVGALSFTALKFVLAPLGAMIIVGMITVVKTIKSERKIEKQDIEIQNPFELKTALKFALVIVIITILVFFIHEYFGNLGLYATAALSVFAAGLPIIVSVVLLATENNVTFLTAAIVVMIASFVSISNDFILQFSLGAKALGRNFIKLMLPHFLAGVIVLIIEVLIFRFWL